MTDRVKFEQMLEHLINEDRETAEALFHELVVAKSREIYENILDDDMNYNYSQGDEMEAVGGDESEDFLNDVEDGGEDEFDSEEDEGNEFGDVDNVEDEFGSEEDAGGEPATKDDVLDIKDALEDLKAEFEAMLAGKDGEDTDLESEPSDEFGGDEFGAEEPEEFGSEEEEEPKESFVREYVENVGTDWHKNAMKGEKNSPNTRSTVAGKNDMGGTSANIAKGGQGSEKGTQGGLLNPSTKDLNSKNVNTPGSRTATKLSGVAKGHGAEKKGTGEAGTDAKSLIGGRKL